MIEVETPDGIAEFPDGTDQATIKAALAKRYGKPSVEETVRQYSVGAYKGLREPLDAAAQMLGKLVGGKFQADIEKTNRDVAEAYKQKSGPASETGRMVGGLVSTAPVMAMPGLAAPRLLPRLGASAAAGGTVGALTPEESGEDFWQRKGQQAAIGAGLGAGITAGLAGAGRAITPIVNRLNPEQQRLAGVFEQEVGPLTAGQATGSKPLMTAESVFAQMPGSAGKQQEIFAKQREAFTRAALKHAGIDGNSASPAVLDAARKKIGAEFDALSAQTTVNVDNQFLNEAVRIQQTYGRKLESQQRDILDNYIDDILNQGQTVRGDVYQIARSDLTRDYKSAARRDPQLSNALRDLRNALDDANDRSIPPHLREAWKDVRRRYGNIKDITAAMEGTGGVSGEISPLALFNAAARGQGRDRFARGAGELNDLSRAGVQFLRPMPDSGTAQRSYMTGMLSGAPMGLGAAAGGYQGGGDPGSIAGGAAAGLLTPFLAQRALASPAMQGYLRNRVMTPGLLGRAAPFGAEALFPE